jgi:signal transduction histidine kinase
MLGFETRVTDSSGSVVMSSSDMLADVNETMMQRMKSLFELPDGVGEFDWYPLYAGGKEIGSLYVRPLKRRGGLPLKEEVFRARGRKFLVISFLIAGGGAALLAVIFARFLSAPIRRLTVLAEKIAAGDFSIQKPAQEPDGEAGEGDEIERLTGSFYYMAEALQKEDQQRRRLTANVAHELRTPLSIIRASVEALEDGVITDPASAMKNVGAEVARLTALVSGIEDITRAEACFFNKGEPETISIAGFVESAVGEMEKMFHDKGLSLRTSGPDVGVSVYPDKLRIILDNLLTNALRHTDAGGVTVQWGKSPTPRSGKGDYYIAVEDTGRGIPPEELPKIFERFHKGPHSTGLGLGLAIAGELASVIGAVIEVESAIGRGSRFTVRF